MKESRYNIYLLDEKEKKGLIYNSMQRSIVHIDDEVYNLMRSGRIEEISDDVTDVLKQGRALIDENQDELQILKIMFNRAKFSALSTGFTIIPTHLCNLACTYCYQGHGDVMGKTMSTETARRAVEFIKKNAVGRKSLGINFYGGEPLLFPDIPFGILEQIKQFTDENGIYLSTSFTSNGTLFTEEIVKNLKDFEHEVQITFCGSREVHDAVRVDKKGNGTYERLMDVISLFRDNDIRFHIRVDIDQENYHTISSLLEDLSQRGFGGLYIGFCPIGKDICYTEMERDSGRIDLVSLTRLFKVAHDMGFRTNPIYIQNFIEGCAAIKDAFLAIDPDGDVYKCIAAPNYKEHRFGTLDESGNLSNVNYDAFCSWTLRDPLLIEECVQCKFAPICAGGCALSAYSKHGSIMSPGCDEKDLGEIMRTYIMLKHPELFEGCSYESIVL
ncbi:MAG: radical SAM protein [Theionarchaea archaeon]|nr:radical SAM protein [Theionarchaea archaeon]MBU7001577.1 radical SAM protein [Theionarchaea archaeon]MBU7021163.1 radical SAM protein [Theionarchaea archaeon]MBU7033891.1 radical SAM protein [Theionarchaea archaeon]MBU7040577.1 radical SAM protein [Theionarchaea archaeon]